MGNLYSSADTIFCKSIPNGCVCYLTHIPPLSSTNITYSPIELSTTVKSVQECRDYISNAYANYNIDFESTSELIEYLDYFGDIERDYECSGICDKKEVYYFSDSSNGEPPKGCKNSIKENLLDGQVLPIGITYLVVGLLVAVVAIIQFGLC
jgi:hypothetical protein